MSVSEFIPTARAVQDLSQSCNVHVDVPLPAFPDGSRLLCCLCAREARAVSYAASRLRAVQSPVTLPHALPTPSQARESMGQSRPALENSATGD